MKKILILNHHGIGDVIMSIPMIKTIKQKDVHITMTFASKIESSLIKEMGFVDKFVYCDFQKKSFPKNIFSAMKFLKSLSGQSFTHGISTAGISTKYSKILFNFLGIKNQSITNIFGKKIKHKVNINLSALKFLGISQNDHIIDLSIELPKNINIDTKKMFGDMFCCIHPGSKEQDKFKRVNPKYLKNIFNQIPDYTFVITGSKSEKNIAENILKIGKDMGVNIFNICGEYDLLETGLIIKNSNFIIGGDSGILHLADSIGTPSLAFFGPTNFEYTGPFSSRNFILKAKNIKCNYPYYIEKDCKCMDNFSIDEINLNLKRIIKKV